MDQQRLIERDALIVLETVLLMNLTKSKRKEVDHPRTLLRTRKLTIKTTLICRTMKVLFNRNQMKPSLKDASTSLEAVMTKASSRFWITFSTKKRPVISNQSWLEQKLSCKKRVSMRILKTASNLKAKIKIATSPLLTDLPTLWRKRKTITRGLHWTRTRILNLKSTRNNW